jgi:peptide/nickel transport system ATP-binding protein
MAEATLSVSGLRVGYKVYGGTLKVLDGVSLSVRPGERIGLVGETGCGKTTVVKSVLRLLPPQGRVSGGQVLFEGSDVLAMTRAEVRAFRSQGIAMVFQDPTAALNPVFTVGTQVQEAIANSAGGRSRAGGAPRDRRSLRERAVSMLSQVSLPDPGRILTNYPFQLSGGMRQRTCIALALSTARKLLVADEPTTSLDVTIQAEILQLVDRIVRDHGTSLVLITHSLGVARRMTDRIYVMYAGTIVETAGTADLYARPLHPYTAGLFASLPRLTGEGFADGIPGRLPDYLSPPAGCRFHPRCPRAMERCAREKPSLVETGPGHATACFLYGAGDGNG